MKIKNNLDERLIKRTLREGSYPDVLHADQMIVGIDESQSLHRNKDLTKRLVSDLEKLYKKLFRDWNDFWDMSTDFVLSNDKTEWVSDRQYCFICGRYIIPKMRFDTTRIKHPYKNHDPCHEYCWGKEMTVERSLGKINPDAELICHVETNGAGVVCRQRIKNIWQEVYAHILTHNIEVNELEFPFEYYRSKYFLRPNGKIFSKVRGYP